MKIYTKFFLVVLFFLVAGCMQDDREIRENLPVAENFVEISPTYSFDGSGLELVSSDRLRCDECYIYVFNFTSSHAGYGDRTGQTVAQIITPHTISVVVKEGHVVQAIIDNEWNEILQKSVESFEEIRFDGVIPVYYCVDTPDSCKEEDDQVCSDRIKDFSSGCMACQDKNTKWYTKGACDQGFSQKAIDDLMKGRITKESAQVLILTKWYFDQQN